MNNKVSSTVLNVMECELCVVVTTLTAEWCCIPVIDAMTPVNFPCANVYLLTHNYLGFFLLNILMIAY